MEQIIPLIVLLVLAVPIAIIATLVSLFSKLRRASEQLDSLARRVGQAELELHRLKEAGAGRTRPVAPPEAQPIPGVLSTEPVPMPPAEEPAPPPMTPPPLAPPPAIPVEEPVFVPPAWAEAEPVVAQAAAARGPLELPPMPAMPESKPALAINWEQFMGVKLFAWIGGFVLFLAVAFFVKYSFERNLIPPELRVAIGFLTGIGLVVGGVLMKRRELSVTSQSLCATGVIILYAVTFACRSVYHFSFFGPLPTFLLMVLITAAAFVLAVQLEAQVVAILGLVGGFLTPVLLSTGVDNPLGLFTYVALLDLGLMAVAFRKRWHYLAAMGAGGTVLMQLGWTMKFFAVEKIYTAMAVFLGFDLLFAAAFYVGEKRKQTNPWLTSSAIGLPFVTFAFVLYLLSHPSLAARPGLLFSFLLAADLCLFALVLLRPAFHQAHVAAGGAVFLILAAWTGQYLSASLLEWALGAYLLFAALHALFPVLLSRLRPDAERTWWGHLFPPVALLLILMPLLKQETVSFLIWPAVLLVDLLAIGLAVLAASVASIVIVLFLTALLTAVWVFRIPTDLAGLPPLLGVMAGFALLFFVVGIFAGKKILAQRQAGAEGVSPLDQQLGAFFGQQVSSSEFMAQVPACSAILPFLLLIMVTARLPLLNPSPVFGLAMLLTVLLLGLALLSRLDVLVPVTLACVLALEYVWHQSHFQAEAARLPLLWYGLFYAAFTVFPFLFRARLAERLLPWAVAALSGPLHFYLVYRAVSLGFPNEYMGLLPAAFALPMLLAVAVVARQVPAPSLRLDQLAWFGGSALLFITLVFPIQFERQWITIGWALEGLALIWLFHRVPHPGLRATGVVLLALAFVRLAFNPAVLEYHRSSTTRVFNWYLYAYGIVTICLLAGARLLAPPRQRVWNVNILPFLYTLGTVLAFLLVNIEIADYFAEGPALTFQFSGNFARDMSYSMAWALFALVLLIVGIWKQLAAVRYAAVGLLVVTLAKLFLHDLSQLGQLYRIGAFVVVAIILMLASFLYQRFVSFEAHPERLKA